MLSACSQTQTPSPRGSACRRGLTLIELIVVLVILTALGALLVPVIGNALTRSHLATCLTNFPEVTKMLIAAEAQRGTLGQGWTNPVLSTGQPALGFIAADYGTLTAAEIDALDELMAANDTTGTGEALFTDLGAGTAADYNVTFNNGVVPGGGAVLQPGTGTGGTPVVVLSNDDARNVFLQNGNGEKYVFFAIDKSWSLLGDLTPEPPVHFGDTEGSLPNQVYSRFGAIFQVADENGPLSIADFKRVTVHIGEAGLGGAFETADAHSDVYWREVNGN